MSNDPSDTAGAAGVNGSINSGAQKRDVDRPALWLPPGNALPEKKDVQLDIRKVEQWSISLAGKTLDDGVFPDDAMIVLRRLQHESGRCEWEADFSIGTHVITVGHNRIPITYNGRIPGHDLDETIDGIGMTGALDGWQDESGYDPAPLAEMAFKFIRDFTPRAVSAVTQQVLYGGG